MTVIMDMGYPLDGNHLWRGSVGEGKTGIAESNLPGRSCRREKMRRSINAGFCEWMPDWRIGLLQVLYLRRRSILKYNLIFSSKRRSNWIIRVVCDLKIQYWSSKLEFLLHPRFHTAPGKQAETSGEKLTSRTAHTPNPPVLSCPSPPTKRYRKPKFHRGGGRHTKGRVILENDDKSKSTRRQVSAGGIWHSQCRAA